MEPGTGTRLLPALSISNTLSLGLPLTLIRGHYDVCS
jgi:hypothetical protein